MLNRCAQKKVFLGKFCLTEQDLFGIGATIHIDLEIPCLPYAEFLKYRKISEIIFDFLSLLATMHQYLYKLNLHAFQIKHFLLL